MFYCARRHSADSCPKTKPQEQRSLTLCTLASRLQKQKARSNPYMVIFNFIGYFILVLRDFSLPGATWPSSCSDFSGFISLLCHPYLPATFSVSGLVFFWSSSLLHYSSLWCSDPPGVKQHHLYLGVYIFITSLHVMPFVIFFSKPSVLLCWSPPTNLAWSDI
jgi:hypothetical protein